ncbi:recombinase [Acetobacter malorum]|uniref:Recombinase n=1 Tax=Acetobacter malorum TaxID=178901 RepID=A0A177G5U0_9PROT|nr:hypothetical protein [Acetobacter malorum]OAG75709.1 recombinase [Acetobacter malorum]
MRPSLEAIRFLIPRIMLIPDNGALGMFHQDDLVVMLSFASNNKKTAVQMECGVLD